MAKDTVMVWWIEADTGELKSQMMNPNDVLGSGTYENEVVIKHARNPIDLTTIHLNRAGNDWEKGEMQRLRDKSAEMRRQLAISAQTPES